MKALTPVCVSSDRNTVQLPHTDVSVLEPLLSCYWVSGVPCDEISSNPVFLSQFREAVSGSTFSAIRHADSGLPHNWRTQEESSARWFSVFVSSSSLTVDFTRRSACFSLFLMEFMIKCVSLIYRLLTSWTSTCSNSKRLFYQKFPSESLTVLHDSFH